MGVVQVPSRKTRPFSPLSRSDPSRSLTSGPVHAPVPPDLPTTSPAFPDTIQSSSSRSRTSSRYVLVVRAGAGAVGVDGIGGREGPRAAAAP